ncbi:MAG: hypothetical protein AAFQ68_21100 [Bacteroidota bacterium]
MKKAKHKEIEIITADGSRHYQLSHIESQWQVLWQEVHRMVPIGEGRTQDDALAIIRDHVSAHFGGVQQVKIR